MPKVIIFGVGQISELVTHFLKTDSMHEICGYTVDQKYIEAASFKGRPVVAWEELENRFPPNEYELFCPISYKQLNGLRKARYLEGKHKGYRYISYIHSSAIISSNTIGENCLILERCTIQPYVEIGDNVILWSNTHVGHHSKIAAHCFIAGCGGIGGNSIVGERCFIGGHFAIADNLTLGEGCLTGLGATIVSSLPENSYVGPPKMRYRQGIAYKLGRKL